MALAGLLLPATVSAGEVWSKWSTPHFTLFSAAPALESTEWAVELEAFFSELATLLPGDPQSRPPLTVVMFADDKGLQPYKPQINGYPAPSTAYFWRNRSYALIALSVREAPQASRRLIYHDGAHWLMGARSGTYPAWFEEGMAELVSSFELTRDQRIIGKPIEEHVIRLKRDGLMPTEEVLALARTSPLYDEGHRDSRFYAQAWALTHLLLFGANGAAPPPVDRYLRTVALGEPSGAAFQKTFGVDAAQMDARLRAYLTSGTYGVGRRPVDRAALEKRLTVAPAEKGETDMTIGLLLFSCRRFDEARAALRSARDQRPNDATAHLYLGMMEYDRRDLVAAKEALDRAISIEPRNAGARFWRAQTKLRARQLADGTLPKLDPAEARAIADDLLVVISLNPADKNSYYALGGVVPSLEPLAREEQVVFETATKRWPGDISLQVTLATVDEKMGRRPEARARLIRLRDTEGPIDRKFRDYARNQINAWDAAARGEEVGKLLAARDYARLRERVDEMLKDGSIPQLERSQWELFRQRAAASEKLDKAEELLRLGERSEAEGLILEVVSTKFIDLETKTRARALQKRLDSPGK